MQDMIDRLSARRERLVAETRRMLDKAETARRALTGAAEHEYNDKLNELRDVSERLKELRADQDDERRSEEYRQRLNGLERTGYRDDTQRDWLPNLAEYRALAEATDSTGGALVPIQYVKSFEDRLRNASVFLNAGPRIIGVDSNQVHIPSSAPRRPRTGQRRTTPSRCQIPRSTR